MYYAVIRAKENDLSHSKGPWRVHKYLRKIGKKYFYDNSKKSNPQKGAMTYAQIRIDKEHSGEEIRKMGKKTFYYDVLRSDPQKGIRTYTYVRSDKERSGEHKPNIKEVERIQEVNSESLFSSWSHFYKPIYEINSKGESVAAYYHEYRVGKIERYARDNEEKIREIIKGLSRGMFRP